MTHDASAWLVDQRWFKAYPLGEDTTIGRGAGSTIILRDAAVSRTHASVRKVGDGYVLAVSGASGTTLNGVPVDAERALREGDVVEIAFTSLKFTLRAPTSEMFVIPHDTPTPIDIQEGPTRVTVRAIKRAANLGHARRGLLRLWRWLTHRPKTD
jgi:pSer/pThr/pTyr-binding forkhead associated (FHA) protein